MIDHDRIVGEIRAFLGSNDRTDQPHLASLAGQYAAACAEANERLSRCGFFLRQGLRSEAIHLAQAEPDVLDNVAVLDFPERAEWDELAMMYGWPKAPALAIETAIALNEAYALEDPLRDLLRRHRRLALARAPLAERLETMRKIARLDAGNPIWAEDIRAFEQVHRDRVARQIDLAAREQNAPALRTALREIEGTDWFEPLPPDLLEAARRASAQLHREAIRAKLVSILDALGQAYSSGDVALGRKHRGRWGEAILGVDLPGDDALWERARPLLDWLDWEDRREAKEREYEDLVAALEAELEHGDSLARLLELEQALLANGRALHTPLQAALKERKRQLQSVKRTRIRIVIGAAAAALLSIGAIAAWSSARQSRSRAIADVSSEIESLVGAGRVREARDQLERIENRYPGASESEELKPLHERVVEAEKAEGERAEKFAKSLQEIHAAPLSKLRPDALDRARALALHAGEKEQVKQLEERINEAVAHDRAMTDRNLIPRLEIARTRFGELERRVERAPGSAESRAAFTELRSEAVRMRLDGTRASDGVRQGVDDLLAKVEAMEAALSAGRDQEGMLEKLAQSASKIDGVPAFKRYIDACNRYATTYPSLPLAQSLRRVLAERPLWETVVAWGSMVRDWPSSTSPSEPNDAAERLKQLDEFRVAYNLDPVRVPFDELHKYQGAIASLASADGAATLLDKTLANPLVQELWLVETLNGKHYYALQRPTKTEAGCQFECVLTLDSRTKPVFVGRANYANMGLSPHARFAQALRKKLPTLASSSALWESGMLAAIQEILDEPGADPLLKCGLLIGLIRAAGRGSYPLEEALKPHAQYLESAGIDLNAAWVDADSDLVELQRRKARETLRRFPSLRPCKKSVEDLHARVEKRAGKVYMPVGILTKDAENGWRCRTAIGVRPGLELYVITPEKAWKKVGTLKGAGESAPSIEPGAVSSCAEGRLVFADLWAR